MNPYILTDESLTVVIDGKAMTMNNDHPAWTQAKEALSQDDWDRLKSLFDVQSAVQDYLDNEAGIEVRNGTVFYEGEAIHNLVVEKILSFMRGGLPYKPLVKFLGKLMENPSARSVNELYKFLEHKNMPLTSEGNFLAYKGVDDGFRDFHTGKFDNSVGQTLQMRRNGVCDDANVGCSSGFHAGSYEYAKGYASRGGNLMVVEIDPRDVVSVPHDCECQKLRTSKYVVVGHYETIDAPPLDDGEMPEYIDWDDDFQANEDSADYGAGWDAGYDQAKKDLS
tara:strand:- start:3475 stop:4314 length:840 start_codon:yes stop_codon:yes gene_type:complete